MSAGPSAGVSDKYWCNPSLEPRSKTEARAHHARCTLRRSLWSHKPQRREFRWHPRSRELFWACLICSGRRRGTLTARASDLVDGKVAFAWLPPEESETLPWAAKKAASIVPRFSLIRSLVQAPSVDYLFGYDLEGSERDTMGNQALPRSVECRTGDRNDRAQDIFLINAARRHSASTILGHPRLTPKQRARTRGSTHHASV